MRYLRQQVINRRAPYDQRLQIDANNSIILSTPSAIQVPAGNTTQRPVYGNRYGTSDTSNLSGMVRYNTLTDALETYQSGVWRQFSFKESKKIIQQSLGNIDGYSYFYGPLNAVYNPSNIDSTNDNFGGQNILVFIGNVFQIWNTNYVVTQNPVATKALSAQANNGATTLTVSSTATIPTGSIVTGSVNLQSNTTATVTDGTTITLNKATTGIITNGTTLTFTSPTGYYLNFTSDASYSGVVGQPITVLHGFDR